MPTGAQYMTPEMKRGWSKVNIYRFLSGK
jgi:hypothetical protein